MNLLEHLMTALDTIRAAKLRAFLTTLGVVIGVFAVIVLVALGGGARQYIAETFASLGTNVLQISPGRRDAGQGPMPPVSGVAHRLTVEDEHAIRRRVSSVNGVSGTLQGSGHLRYANSVTDMLSAVLVAIACISLLVGGIGIANIMLVSVRERTREIGIRRAVGATRHMIMMQFLVEAVVIAMAGGLMGLVLGVGGIAAIRLSVPELPLRISAHLVVTALGFSFIVGILSGVAPALRAAHLDPVDALRHE